MYSMDSVDKGVHDGHRARMRAKFAEHGPRIFDTYELVEMLLYHAVPMRDTNPIAKRLLATFGGLAGLLRSEREELLKVPGIGEKTADLIRLVGRADTVGRLSADVKPRVIFDDYHATGRFVQKYISETGATAAVFLLDDSMHLLGAVNVETTKFGSGATRPKPFVDAVVRYSASYSVIGFTNGNGLAHPFSSDIVTCDMLAKEISTVGATLAECYIVGDGSYASVGPRRILRNSSTPEARRFDRSRYREHDSHVYEIANPTELELGIASETTDTCVRMLAEYLEELLSYSAAKADGRVVDDLIGGFGSLDSILSQPMEILTHYTTERAVNLLKLVAALVSRAVQDAFKLGTEHSESEIMRYICALFYGTHNETVYLLSLDSRGRVTHCDYIGEGTVNTADVPPRKVAEIAVRRGAASVVLAHNHPSGVALPSSDDKSATAGLFETCRALGVSLAKHVIVAERSHYVLKPDPVEGVVKTIGFLD